MEEERRQEQELARMLIEKGLIVRPDDLPEEYNGVPLFECMMMVTGKPERQMKPSEKAFIRAFTKSFKNYEKEEKKKAKK